MSFGSDAGTSGTAATQINVDPYAPAQPALNQIVSEASSIYNLIAQAAQDVYSGVSSQFSGAGRTPGSPMSQQEVVSQVAGKALPYAFQSYDAERARQLQTAQSLPGVTQVGQTLEGYETQRLNAPQTALSNYANIANTVARGGQSTTTLPPAPNRMGQALGGAMIGSAIGNQTYGGMPGVIGGGIFGALGGLL